jgi:beta-glucosidase-like glycosyl hydrolase
VQTFLQLTVLQLAEEITIVDMSLRQLNETYLPPFKAAAELALQPL